MEATMKIDRHLSNRFERGTRERRLIRSFEDGFALGETFSKIALVDMNTQHELVLFCQNDETTDHVWHVWKLKDDPDDYENEIFSYDSYDEAAQRFDLWSNEEVRPNWEAQAEYDELHGTVNGEDAGIVMMRELWGE
jgi:hypothetical protein